MAKRGFVISLLESEIQQSPVKEPVYVIDRKKDTFLQVIAHCKEAVPKYHETLALEKYCFISTLYSPYRPALIFKDPGP